jgi:MerR family Zn(II)-responsive transcriptional regulator of zntA
VISRIRSRRKLGAGLDPTAGKRNGAPPARPQTTRLERAAPEGARLTIGKLAKRTEVSLDTIRFYEDERLLMPAGKTAAGYRLYAEDAVQRLEFIKHAQHCGMTLSEIRQLLEMKSDDRACCNDVRSLAIRKKLQLEHKIKTMTAMSEALSQLIEICTGEQGPITDCPILAALESSLANSRATHIRFKKTP